MSGNIGTTEHPWEFYRILNTFTLYLKCGFYKTILFSTIFYPILVILNLPRAKIKKRKDEILINEMKKYILNKYGLKIPEIKGPYALGALVNVFCRELYDFFKISEKDTVYDLGATIGEYSLKCAKKGAVCLAFESERDPYYLAIVKNIKANGFEKKIIPFNCRIDNKKNSLDSFLNKTKKPPTLMKIVLEGDEIEVLRGAKKILKNHKPKLILQTHSEELRKDCLDLLKKNGYKIIRQIDKKARSRKTILFFLRHSSP